MVSWFSLKVPDNAVEERIVFSVNGAGTTVYLHSENKVGPLSHTIYKN